MNYFEGKVAIVTGGGKGVGAACLVAPVPAYANMKRGTNCG